ncbi:MAG TPA: class I SAM-dependent rRNA methyltransferase [Polyangiaceae bacterium]
MPRPSVKLSKELARSIRKGHPWVYRDAVAGAPKFDDGTLVDVRGKDNRWLATGFWDGSSPIAVRVLSRERFEEIEPLLRARLDAALERRLARLDRTRTTAFRWVHGEADELPGVHVDVYGEVAMLRFDGAGARAAYRSLAGELARTKAWPIARALDRESRSAAGTIEVLENGLRFLVDLAHGQKGGLFLDQRENRAEVEARSSGRRVLNLFGYTGAFSLYAARGGALRTDTVDQAKPAIAAARRNFELNGFATDADHAGFHARDAFEFLDEAKRKRKAWDLVICDPPSFAKSRSSLPSARKAYRRLFALAAAVVTPGGIFCPASCSSHFSRQEFSAAVKDAVATLGRRFELERLAGAGFDHPVIPAFPEGDYLKFALGKLR